MIYAGKNYVAKWNSQLNKDHFRENGTISFSVEARFFFLGRRWIPHGRFSFKAFYEDYQNGTISFMQSVNRRRVFGFDVSVLVLIKHTKNLDIIYTSSVLSFLPRSFVLGNYTSDSEVYCNWWFTDSYENVVIMLFKFVHVPWSLLDLILIISMTVQVH